MRNLGLLVPEGQMCMAFGSTGVTSKPRIWGMLLAAGLYCLGFPVGAAAQEGPYLELVDVIPDKPYGRWPVVEPGHLVSEPEGDDQSYRTEHSWTAPPATMDGRGFDITVTATLTSNVDGPLTGGTSISTHDFDWDTSERGAYFTVPGHQTASRSLTIRVTPSSHLADGSIAELWVGGSYGPGVRYKYRVSNTPIAGGGVGTNPPPAVQPQGQLAAELDCPGEIVISALPSLNCHIVITSWRRNTADPVEVILPGAIDTFGNHANGIQVLAAGTQDVANQDLPFRWGMFIFACPAEQGTGANCYDSVTLPGPTAVDIIVRQEGSPDVNLVLALNALGRGGAATGGVVRFGNVWRVGQFINLEESGGLASRTIRADWLSAQWEMQPVAGTEFVRLKNLWKPDQFIHTETGSLGVGAIQSGWYSAMWLVEPVAGTAFVRLRNRWMDQQYLNTETGELSVSPTGQQWLSAMWWTLP